jgi:hypothetical protein
MSVSWNISKPSLSLSISITFLVHLCFCQSVSSPLFFSLFHTLSLSFSIYLSLSFSLTHTHTSHTLSFHLYPKFSYF